MGTCAILVSRTMYSAGRGRGIPDQKGTLTLFFFQDLQEQILEAQRNKELAELIRPIEFLAWARHHRIDFSDELEQAVSANEFDIAQLQLRYEQKEQQLNRKIQDL